MEKRRNGKWRRYYETRIFIQLSAEATKLELELQICYCHSNLANPLSLLFLLLYLNLFLFILTLSLSTLSHLQIFLHHLNSCTTFSPPLYACAHLFTTTTPNFSLFWCCKITNNMETSLNNYHGIQFFKNFIAGMFHAISIASRIQLASLL